MLSCPGHSVGLLRPGRARLHVEEHTASSAGFESKAFPRKDLRLVTRSDGYVLGKNTCNVQIMERPWCLDAFLVDPAVPVGWSDR